MDNYEEIIKNCRQRMSSSLSNFGDNLKKIRTGRASPAMLDGIYVDYYGNETPLNQCCSITVEDSKTLSLSPWDKSLVKEIDRAIHKSDLGINPTTQGEIIRIIMPPLTEESRIELTKKGHNLKNEPGGYGGYQAIMNLNNVYYGASESRKDGHASGY